MSRDHGLETLLADDLRGVRGLTQKAMFGGMAWLLDGKLLCGARTRGLLLRLGKGNDLSALQLPGVTSMVMRGKSLGGWIEVAPEACGDEVLRRSLIEAALRFVRSLPSKEPLP